MQQITHATGLICKRQQCKTYMDCKMIAEQKQMLCAAIYETRLK